MIIPTISSNINNEQRNLLTAIAKSCRRSILEMVTNAQSGHPGGSLSSIDYLVLLYTFIISQTGDKVIISNGHISPGAFSILAELGYVNKTEVINSFRQVDSKFEGHVARSVNGIEFGTGPLGIGLSAAAGIALAQKKTNQNSKKVFVITGDGECEEGQAYEMMNFASKHKLNNLIVFMDYNHVQLSDSTENIMPIDYINLFRIGGWKVIECDGHDFDSSWKALQEASFSNLPTIIIGHTIMGKGVGFMEHDGEAHHSTWHGRAPKLEQTQEALTQLELSEQEKELINEFRKSILWFPSENSPIQELSVENSINIGTQIVYSDNDSIDCRTAYGNALLDLARNNQQIVGMSADLKPSVMTNILSQALPDKHIECGIAEQNMLSAAGGMSLNGLIPFVSTFGVFMTSRAKDQARVNDINQCNVKMVATHCGLSVGQDGPTHQALDDMSSFIGFYNTMIIEPADPNQTDRIIRYVAAHHGNFYVRMGRHKFPIIKKIDGTPYYDEQYIYEYGKTDIIREGADITIAATGAMVNEALKAIEIIGNNMSVELIAVSSIKRFDENIFNSIRKTKNLITIEDHNNISGLSTQLSKEILLQDIHIKAFSSVGVSNYQSSGDVESLYKSAEINSESIAEKCINQIKKSNEKI
jgi:transketolase